MVLFVVDRCWSWLFVIDCSWYLFDVRCLVSSVVAVRRRSLLLVVVCCCLLVGVDVGCCCLWL